MAVGFATNYPANRWLVRRGIKEAMWVIALSITTRAVDRP
jgi:hypothetical protein